MNRPMRELEELNESTNQKARRAERPLGRKSPRPGHLWRVYKPRVLRANYSTFGCQERSKSFYQIKTRSKKSSSLVHVTLQSTHKIKTRSKKSSSLVHVTLQSLHKIKKRSKEEFQPCACDLEVTPQKKNQDQKSSSH
jgi:hypothetical protein